MRTATDSFLAPLARPLFRYLWLGQAASLVAVQMMLVALPWWAFRETDSSVGVGSILAAVAIPRALFIFTGGVLVDRFSPQRLLLISALGRSVLAVLLFWGVYAGSFPLSAVLIAALGLGLADAASFPAQGAVVPSVVPRGAFSQANALLATTTQSALFLGPLLAGILISAGTRLSGETVGGPESSTTIVFACAAALFLGGSLLFLRMGRSAAPFTPPPERGGASGGSLRGILTDSRFAVLSLFIAVSNLLITGPFFVGMPVLSDRLDSGASGYAFLMAANGAGSIVGGLAAGGAWRGSEVRFGPRLAWIMGWQGIGLACLGFSPSLLFSLAITASMGAAYGYVAVSFVSWLQAEAEPERLGRVMGAFLTASVGLHPISMALAGLFVGEDPVTLFFVSGALMAVFSMLVAFTPSFRRLGARSRIGATL